MDDLEVNELGILLLDSHLFGGNVIRTLLECPRVPGLA